MKSPSQGVLRCWTSWDFGQSARRDVESTPWKQEGGYLGTARKYLRVFVAFTNHRSLEAKYWAVRW